jgi:serine O-acetyltransferase
MFRLVMILPWVNWKDNKFILDLDRWQKIFALKGSRTVVLANLLWSKKEFRNLFIYRNSHRRIFRCWIALWYRPMDTLFIETPEIGGGLFIQHGFATMIAAKSIGENCWINQGCCVFGYLFLCKGVSRCLSGHLRGRCFICIPILPQKIQFFITSYACFFSHSQYT